MKGVNTYNKREEAHITNNNVTGGRSDVEGSIGGSDVAGGNEDHVHDGPDAEAAKREELPNGALPQPQVEPIRTESPERRRECLYYLALGNYKLGNYAEARRYNDLLLDREPANLQASNLRQLIDDRVAKEGLVGVAILGGVGLAAGLVGAFVLKSARRR